MRLRRPLLSALAALFAAVRLAAQDPAVLGQPVPAPGAPAQAAPAAQGPVAPAVPALTPAQLDDKRRLLSQARGKSGELTTAAVSERLELWKMVLIIDPTDVEARLGYEQAQRDLETARTQEAAKQLQNDAAARTEAQQQADRREKLALAERALYARDLNSAEQIVTGVLAQSPDDPRANSMAAAIRQAQNARRFTRRMLIAAGALGVFGAGILVLLRKLGGKSAADAKSGPVGPRAIVKVIDGVGRGRLAPVEKEVFRIGAADGEREDEKNDLVISDSAALVSRYHCTILRKGRDYFVLDSSLNGTRLNDRPLQRGEHQPLDDGDEIVLAGASRLKFLHT
jgi:flagellar motor protein MotB